jgi:DNA-binding NarL/FixJ family response regulator
MNLETADVIIYSNQTRQSISKEILKVTELILIVAKPGRLRDALCALLKATFWLELISQADDGPAALKIVAEHHPGLVLFDSHLSDEEIRAVLHQIKTEQPQTCCIVLANTVKQQLIAKKAGADEVLPQGFPITNLLGAINKLMSWQEI